MQRTTTSPEHSSVVLTEALPAAGLEAGDVGVIVHVHDNGIAYEVEFLALDGSTLAIETLEAQQVRAAESGDIPHVRHQRSAA